MKGSTLAKKKDTLSSIDHFLCQTPEVLKKDDFLSPCRSYWGLLNDSGSTYSTLLHFQTLTYTFALPKLLKKTLFVFMWWYMNLYATKVFLPVWKAFTTVTFTIQHRIHKNLSIIYFAQPSYVHIQNTMMINKCLNNYKVKTFSIILIRSTTERTICIPSIAPTVWGNPQNLQLTPLLHVGYLVESAHIERGELIWLDMFP